MTRDIPETLALAAGLAPWRWDWAGFLRILVHLVVLLTALGGAGSAVRRLFRTGAIPAAERIGGALALGMGAAGSGVLALGLLGLLHQRLLVAVYLLAAVHGIMRLAAARPALPRIPDRMPGPGAVVLLLLVMWPLPFLAADLRAPEGFWDAIVYHLGVPVRFLEMRKAVLIRPFFAQFPLLASMNWTLALAVLGEGLARALNLAAGGALVAAAASVGSGLAPGRGLLIAALVATSPLLCLLAVHAGSDTLAALCGVLAVGSFVRACPRWPRGPVRPASLVLAGILAGLAGACKLPGLAVPAVLAVLAAAVRPGAAAASAAAAFAAAALLPILPWFARGWLLTANPVFPLAAGVFPSPLWAPFSRRVYGEEISRIFGQFSFADYPRAWTGASEASRFALGLVGPVLPLAALVAVALGARSGAPALLLCFVAGLAGIWAGTAPAWRFLGAGLVMSAPLVALLAGDRILRVVPAAVLVVQAVWVPIVLDRLDRPWAFARGEETREAYYSGLHANPGLDATGYLARHARPGPRTRVLASGDVRTLLLPPWTRSVSYFEPSPLPAEARDAGSARRLFVRLRQQGVRYLLVNVGESVRLRLFEGLTWEGRYPEAVLGRFFREHVRLRFARGSAWVYEVESGGKGAAVPECFRDSGCRDARTGLVCASRARALLGAGDLAAARRFGWAAVAACERSGFAWSALGDCLFASGKWEDAVGAYREALVRGWTTSAVYRNRGVALAKMGRYPYARESLEYATRVDPDLDLLRREIGAINEAEFGSFPGPGKRGGGP